jgi:hypothetical protein
MCYMPCPSHPSWFDNSDYTWRKLQVMKILVTQFYHCKPWFLNPRDAELRMVKYNVYRRTSLVCWHTQGKPAKKKCWRNPL